MGWWGVSQGGVLVGVSFFEGGRFFGTFVGGRAVGCARVVAVRKLGSRGMWAWPSS